MQQKEIKQLDQGDLNVLKQIKNANNELLQELGQIKLLELNLESRINSAKEYQTQLIDKERQISKQLQDKYGQGSIDLNSGTFLPAK
jgi:hypothetical protein